MFRLKVLYFFIPLVLFVITTSAQINAKLSVGNVQCMHSALGSAKVVIIDPVNPPYSFQWSNGENSSGQSVSYAQNLEVQNYFVVVTDGLGYDTTISFTVLEMECRMMPESVFTPNGDGYNDFWNIGNARYFPNSMVLVYNRWGQKVYDFKGLYEVLWDGQDQMGNPLPVGEYYYIIYADKAADKSIIKGSLTIFR